MSLLLKVLSFKGQPLPEAMQLVIDRHGATIGRSDLNTLVLPDPEKFISRHHATITYEQGHYHLSDCSLSGIFIDTQKIPIRNESRLLSDGMLLRIGEYKISVIISDPSETQPNTSSYADEFSNNDSPLPNVTRTSKTKSNKAATKSDIEHIEEITTLNYQKSHRIEVDENIDSASPFCTELLEAFLQGVGLYRDDIKIHHPAETMEKIGQMFREMVKGTIAVLRSRAEFKSFFRVTMTVMKPSHNNPLKAIVSTDDVLRQLLQDEAVDFIDSVDAIEQGFSDVMDHQLAMQAGIKASLAHLLKTFDPDSLEKRFTQGILLQKNAKCWERYKASYQDTANEALDNFFGDAFVTAYEKQMKILMTMRKSR